MQESQIQQKVEQKNKFHNFDELVAVTLREFRRDQRLKQSIAIQGVARDVFSDAFPHSEDKAGSDVKGDDDDTIPAEFEDGTTTRDWKEIFAGKAQSDSEDTAGRDLDEGLRVDYDQINEQIAFSDRAVAALVRSFDLENHWVETTFRELLAANRIQRWQMMRRLRGLVKESRQSAIPLNIVADSLEYLLAKKKELSLAEVDKAVIHTFLQALEELYRRLPILEEEQRAREYKAAEERKKRKLSRRAFLVGSGAAGLSLATGIYALSREKSATGQRLRTIGRRDFERYSEKEIAELTDYSERDEYLSSLFVDNVYELREYFSHEQWGHVSNALKKFSTSFYSQYARQEHPPSLLKITEQYVSTLYEAAEAYDLPFGILLQLTSIASQKYNELQVYQEEEIPTYRAQTYLATLAALFTGDSHATAEISHAFATRFGPGDTLVGTLAAPAQMPSTQLPMDYGEVNRFPLPTINSHDVEVDRYVDGLQVSDAHRNHMEKHYPDYVREADVLIKAREELDLLKEQIFYLIASLEDEDELGHLESLRTAVTLKEAGISAEHIDSWQFTHYTRSWQKAILYQNERGVATRSEAFFAKVFDHEYYKQMPIAHLIGEQVLNVKFLKVLKKVATAEGTTVAMKDTLHKLIRARDAYASQVSVVHAAQARVERQLLKHENEPDFEAHIGAAFIKSLYDQVAEMLGTEITEESKFSRDAQGIFALFICYIREITPSTALITVDTPEGIKSPLVDAVYNEKKVLSIVQECIARAREINLIQKEIPILEQLNEIYYLFFELKHGGQILSGEYFDEGQYSARFHEMKDRIYAPLASAPQYAADDGMGLLVGYLDASAAEGDREEARAHEMIDDALNSDQSPMDLQGIH